jgi:8-oxo-dGTP pyrophosphatase MutT (NUDIX family)
MKPKGWKIRPGHKSKAQKQYAALPYAVRNGELLVMLVTSRETHRWIIPKGWPERSLRGHEVAELEAFEEAGILGEASVTPLGSFDYHKGHKPGHKPFKEKRCSVEVFPLAVREELDEWPEKGQRRRVWLTPLQAAARISDGNLVEILLNFPRVANAL